MNKQQKGFLFTLLFVIFLTTFQSCNEEKESQKELISGQMNRCLDENLSAEIAKSVEIFENKLLEFYELEETDLSKAYKNYVEDISAGKMNPDFYISNSAKENLNFIKNSSIISIIYKNEEFPGATMYYVNTEGAFAKCLLANQLIRSEERKFLKNFVIDTKITSREIAGNMLMNFLKDSYNISINRVMIAFFLYYPSLLSLNS